MINLFVNHNATTAVAFRNPFPHPPPFWKEKFNYDCSTKHTKSEHFVKTKNEIVKIISLETTILNLAWAGGFSNRSFRKTLFRYLNGPEQLNSVFFLRRLDGLETPVKEKVVDDLEATGNDEGKAQ